MYSTRTSSCSGLKGGLVYFVAHDFDFQLFKVGCTPENRTTDGKRLIKFMLLILECSFAKTLCSLAERIREP